MKQIVGLVLLIMLTFVDLSAEEFEGQIVFNDTIVDVIFDLPTTYSGEIKWHKLQYKVKYIDKEGNKKKLRPNDAEEIRFTYGFSTTRLLSRKAPQVGGVISSESHMFFRLSYDGAVKIFIHYRKGYSDGSYIRTLVLQKGNGALKVEQHLQSRTSLKRYFYDCPVLVQKIEDKRFDGDQLPLICQFCNSRCQ